MPSSELESVRAKAVATMLRDRDVLDRITRYIGGKRVAVYGIPPGGTMYGAALATKLCTSLGSENVGSVPYLDEKGFEEGYVRGRRVLAVDETVSSNGQKRSVARNAAKAIFDGYIQEDDFRLVTIHPFHMFEIRQLYPEFDKIRERYLQRKAKVPRQGEK